MIQLPLHSTLNTLESGKENTHMQENLGSIPSSSIDGTAGRGVQAQSNDHLCICCAHSRPSIASHQALIYDMPHKKNEKRKRTSKPHLYRKFSIKKHIGGGGKLYQNHSAATSMTIRHRSLLVEPCKARQGRTVHSNLPLLTCREG